MSGTEYATFWTTVFIYLVATGLAMTGFVMKRERMVSADRCLSGLTLTVTFVAHTSGQSDPLACGAVPSTTV